MITTLSSIDRSDRAGPASAGNVVVKLAWISGRSLNRDGAGNQT
jgi:hypothetical protein